MQILSAWSDEEDEVISVKRCTMGDGAHSQTLEELPMICLTNESAKHLHDKEKQHQGEQVALTEAACMVDALTGAAINHDLSV
jgi:hypothetical protein